MIQPRHRVVAGFGCIAAGVIVAVLGYLGVAGETEVAFQLPYFASAGVGALMLLGFGSVLLVNAQLEGESDRIAELEEAIRGLCDEVARLTDEVAPVRARRSLRTVAPDHPAGGERRRGGQR